MRPQTLPFMSARPPAGSGPQWLRGLPPPSAAPPPGAAHLSRRTSVFFQQQQGVEASGPSATRVTHAEQQRLGSGLGGSDGPLAGRRRERSRSPDDGASGRAPHAPGEQARQRSELMGRVGEGAARHPGSAPAAPGYGTSPALSSGVEWQAADATSHGPSSAARYLPLAVLLAAPALDKATRERLQAFGAKREAAGAALARAENDLARADQAAAAAAAEAAQVRANLATYSGALPDFSAATLARAGEAAVAQAAALRANDELRAAQMCVPQPAYPHTQVVLRGVSVTLGDAHAAASTLAAAAASATREWHTAASHQARAEAFVRDVGPRQLAQHAALAERQAEAHAALSAAVAAASQAAATACATLMAAAAAASEHVARARAAAERVAAECAMSGARARHRSALEAANEAVAALEPRLPARLLPPAPADATLRSAQMKDVRVVAAHLIGMPARTAAGGAQANSATISVPACHEVFASVPEQVPRGQLRDGALPCKGADVEIPLSDELRALRVRALASSKQHGVASAAAAAAAGALANSQVVSEPVIGAHAAPPQVIPHLQTPSSLLPLPDVVASNAAVSLLQSLLAGEHGGLGVSGLPRPATLGDAAQLVTPQFAPGGVKETLAQMQVASPALHAESTAPSLVSQQLPPPLVSNDAAAPSVPSRVVPASCESGSGSSLPVHRDTSASSDLGGGAALSLAHVRALLAKPEVVRRLQAATAPTSSKGGPQGIGANSRRWVRSYAPPAPLLSATTSSASHSIPVMPPSVLTSPSAILSPLPQLSAASACLLLHASTAAGSPHDLDATHLDAVGAATSANGPGAHLQALLARMESFSSELNRGSGLLASAVESSHRADSRHEHGDGKKGLRMAENTLCTPSAAMSTNAGSSSPPGSSDRGEKSGNAGLHRSGSPSLSKEEEDLRERLLRQRCSAQDRLGSATLVNSDSQPALRGPPQRDPSCVLAARGDGVPAPPLPAELVADALLPSDAAGDALSRGWNGRESEALGGAAAALSLLARALGSAGEAKRCAAASLAARADAGQASLEQLDDQLAQSRARLDRSESGLGAHQLRAQALRAMAAKLMAGEGQARAGDKRSA